MKKKRTIEFSGNRELKLKFRKMKLTVILLFLGLVTFGNSFSQARLSFHLNNADIRETISMIEAQSNCVFLYKDDIFDFSQKISVYFSDTKVEDVIKAFCELTEVDYEILDRQVLLKAREVEPGAAPDPIEQPQQKEIRGKITDADGNPLPGASVVVKGTTIGTTSDPDGNYSLPGIPEDGTLVFSFVGMKSQEVAITGQTTINIALESDLMDVEEVVVTALGIKKQRKALGYAVQDVSGDALTEARDANVANALAGKIAGVQIRQNGTGVGGSTRIVIRGNNSIAGNNQPLIVVDGIPIDNFASSPADYWGNSTIDKGSGLGDISPDDIESISILKGGAAAALYGSRAGNGVVLVTTKSGSSSRGLGISFSSNFTFENPMQVPSFQNEYGQGVNGVFDNNQVGSWGPKMDGKTVEMALGSFPYAARQNDLYKDFLQTGTSWTNSVELSKANENLTYRFSVTRLDNKAVVPNSGMDRTTVNFSATAKLAEWITAESKINYINQNTKNRISLARDPNNIFMDNLYRPRSVSFSDYEAYRATDWKRADGKPAAYVLDHNASPDNVFWMTEKNRNSDKRDRYIGMIALNLSLTDWLKLKLRTGMDNYSFFYDLTRATGNPYWEVEGSYRTTQQTFKEINSDWLLTADKNFGDLGLTATVGGNVMKREATEDVNWSGALEIPDFYTISAGREHQAFYSTSEKQINSLYGTASLSYLNALYLDLSLRGDWSSTLPSDKNNYWYPSVSGSWVFSETLGQQGIDLKPISFGKLRASWAEVGNDTDPYMLANTFGLDYNIKDGLMEVTRQNWRANPNLRNETVRSIEAGFELRAWQNRVGIDVSYYKKNAFNQILRIAIPPATGYSYDLVNAGNIQNQGWELALNATLVKARGFEWNTLINWSTNKNKIISLTKTTKRQILSEGTGLPFQIVAEEGGSYGDIYGTAYERDNQGNIVIGASGVPVQAAELKNLGNTQPKGMLSWSNTLTLNNLSLGWLVDMSYGAKVFMGSIQTGTNHGTLAMTSDYREGNLVVEGVKQDGTPNDVSINAEQYWKGISGINEAFIYDAANIRLRELSFSYSVPQRLLARTPFTSLKAGVVARNLFMIYSTTEGFDPEAGFSNANSVMGVEFNSMPTMRSIGFNINVSF